MKLTPIALAVMLGGFAAATPALAQYSSPPPAAAKTETQAQAQGPKINVSSGARKEIAALQAAVNSKDAAAIQAALAAAQAKAKTKDDHYAVGQLQLRAAVDANDKTAMLAGLQAVIGSGFLSAAETVPLYRNVGQLHFAGKSYDAAGAAFEQILKIDPNDLEATVMLGETRNAQGRAAE